MKAAIIRGMGGPDVLSYEAVPHATLQALDDVVVSIQAASVKVGSGSYAGQRDEVFKTWRTAVCELVHCPNVMVKLSGLGGGLGGFGFEGGERAPSSEVLAQALRPCRGWRRASMHSVPLAACMAATSPVDKGESYSHAVGLNAVKRIARGAAPSENG